MVQRSLYEMIGVSADADRQDVRLAYEQAMRTATRRGDHRRAVELSAAYDALDPRTRRDIFPAARSGPGSARGEHTAGLHPSDYDLGPLPTAGSRRRAGRALRPGRMLRRGRPVGGRSRRPAVGAWGRRAVAGIVAVAVVLLIGTYVWRTEFPRTPAVPAEVRHQQQLQQQLEQQRQQQLDQQQLDQQQPANQLVVPDDAPVGTSGMVTVSCAGASGSYDLTARPGDTVSCGNGATPQLVTTG